MDKSISGGLYCTFGNRPEEYIPAAFSQRIPCLTVTRHTLFGIFLYIPDCFAAVLDSFPYLSPIQAGAITDRNIV